MLRPSAALGGPRAGAVRGPSAAAGDLGIGAAKAGTQGARPTPANKKKRGNATVVNAGFESISANVGKVASTALDVSDPGVLFGLAFPVALLGGIGLLSLSLEGKLEATRAIAEAQGIDCSDVPNAEQVKELEKVTPGASWANTPSKRYGVVAMRLCWKLAEDRCKEEGIDASWGDPAKTPYQTRYQILKERLQENGIAFNGYSEINKLR